MEPEELEGVPRTPCTVRYIKVKESAGRWGRRTDPLEGAFRGGRARRVAKVTFSAVSDHADSASAHVAAFRSSWSRD